MPETVKRLNDRLFPEIPFERACPVYQVGDAISLSAMVERILSGRWPMVPIVPRYGIASAVASIQSCRAAPSRRPGIGS